jgi:hypothetical protein
MTRLTAASDGNYYAAIQYFPAPNSPEGYLLKLRPDGAVIWSKKFAGSGPGYHTFSAWTATPDGGIAVAAPFSIMPII